MRNFDVIAFDADDTLWVNEPLYRDAELEMQQIVSRHVSLPDLSDRLYQREIENLKIFGYGAKGFMLSMIETAIELTNEKISAGEVQEIINLGRDLLSKPIEVLDGVRDVLHLLSPNERLMLLTKGDLFDQETKLARSGLAAYFENVEIVSEKNIDSYAQVLKKYNLEPQRFLMIGNSLKSDILPIVELGAHAVHIPYITTWEHEKVADGALDGHHYYRLESIREMPELLEKLKDG